MGEFALFASSVAVMTVIELILTGSILFPLFLFLGLKRMFFRVIFKTAILSDIGLKVAEEEFELK